MNRRDAGEPLDPSAELQLLVAVGVLSAPAVWRLNKRNRMCPVGIRPRCA